MENQDEIYKGYKIALEKIRSYFEAVSGLKMKVGILIQENDKPEAGAVYCGDFYPFEAANLIKKLDTTKTV